MNKKLEQLFFPLFIYSTLILCPILFSFDSDQLNQLTYSSSNNVSQLNETNFNKVDEKVDEIILKKLFFWGKSTKDSVDELKTSEILTYRLYSKNDISIFSEAIESLMNYYIPLSSFDELPSKYPTPWPSPAVSMDEKSPKVYLAVRPPRYNTPGFGSLGNPNYGDSNIPKDFFFPNFDKYKNVAIPQKFINNGHTAVRKQTALLPRLITNQDSKIKFFKSEAKPMFIKHYSDYFEIDFKKQFGKDPKTLKPKKVRRVLAKYWDTESGVRKKAYAKLKDDLFLKDSVLKLTGCRYSFETDPVIIYYDLHTDLFGIVNEKTNSFVTGGIASLCDYIDIYYFKWLGADRTFNQSVQFKVSTDLEKPFLLELSEDQKFSDYDKNRDLGLPTNYNPEKWWEDAQKDLEKRFLQLSNKDNAWYDNLKIGDGEKINDVTVLEAFTMLQLEAENYLSGVYRPDKINDPMESDIDTDVRFKDFNSDRIQSCKPTMADIKVLIDPKALQASKKTVRTLEQQLEDVTDSVKFQQIRATTEFNETVLHVINLFRIRPVDRDYVIAAFKAKAIKKGVDLNCILFLNISNDSIY